MQKDTILRKGWRFHLGDIPTHLPTAKGPAYISSKTERMKFGPAACGYRDVVNDYGRTGELKCENWEPVTLPHDFVIGGPFDRTENQARGYQHYDCGWYRLHFRLPDEAAEKRITLYFEGAATDCTVYLNGCPLHRNHCGYTPFEVDISDFAVFGERDNILAVFCDARIHEGWWYEGGGLYRPVHLCIQDRVCIPRWGVFALPRLEGDHWILPVEVTLHNDDPHLHTLSLRAILRDSAGKEVLSLHGQGTAAPFTEETVLLQGEVDSPALWSVAHPNLYTLTVTMEGDGFADETSLQTGFRSFRMDPDQGFFLNGEHVKIHGVCGHADCAIFGKAVPDNVHRYRVRLMKEMGANGYRTSHYPQSEAMMDEMDREGFIVLDETRWFDSSPEGLEALRRLILRDRNHPCVFFWSVGNEEPMHIDPRGEKIARRMMALAARLDPTRPATTAVCDTPEKSTVYHLLPIIGINYNLDSFDRIHAVIPDKPMLSTECCATGTTRGWYRENAPELGYIYGYDRDTDAWFLGREKTEAFFAARPFIMGGYQWTAFEHRGETQWPRLCSQSGAIDLFLQKKDAFYQNRSLWTEEPMVHLLPHWNHHGLEGQPILVRVYTNCPRVTLFLNGTQIGQAEVGRPGHADFTVPYTPGVLTAVGEKDGVTVQDTQKTTGVPVALRLHRDLDAPGEGDVALFTCTVLDSEGREVPDGECTVRFSCVAGAVLGTGSDISDHTPVSSPIRRMRAGRILVAVRPGQDGNATLYAESPGLATAAAQV